MVSLNLGLLGASRIAPTAIVAPATTISGVVVEAVAARLADRAAAFAKAHGIPVAVGGYDALFEVPGLDAVYVGLPISAHAKWTLAALQHGMHVLCEKPFALSSDEARMMVAAASSRGLVLMEAFHYRFHPLFEALLDVVRSGEIGRIQRIAAIFNAPVEPAPGEIRFDPALGGGALWDLGSYCVHWVRSIMGSEPAVGSASQVMTPTGVDQATTALLIFSGGVEARIDCDMAAPFHAAVTVTGDAGEVQALNPLAPQFGHALKVTTAEGTRSQTFTRRPTYDFQLLAFLDAVRSGGVPLTGGGDAIAQMVVLEAIRDAARPNG
jgi:predicted dehydrogenase